VFGSKQSACSNDRTYSYLHVRARISGRSIRESNHENDGWTDEALRRRKGGLLTDFELVISGIWLVVVDMVHTGSLRGEGGRSG